MAWIGQSAALLMCGGGLVMLLGQGPWQGMGRGYCQGYQSGSAQECCQGYQSGSECCQDGGDECCYYRQQSQPGWGCCSGAEGGWGRRARGEPGRGMLADADHYSDMQLFHFLLDNRQQIQRTVTELADGVDTLTESEDSEIAKNIQRHVASMHARLQQNRPIHMRDPLFREIFANTSKISMVIENTEKGARVRETSQDTYVAKLIQEHARVVSRFLEFGYSEMHKNHLLPSK